MADIDAPIAKRGPDAVARRAGLPDLRRGTPMLAGAGGMEAPAARELSVNELWRMLVKWRWLVIGTTAAGLAIAIVVTLLMKPVYRGVATIEINDEPTQVVQIGQVQPQSSGSPDSLSTQIGLLGSRSLAERVARDLNLPNRADLVDQALPRAVRADVATGAVQGGFKSEPVRDSRLVKLEFDSRDPNLAARVANGYADGFIAANLDRRFETTAYARDFLQNRIASVKTHLEASERQLVGYARQEGIIDVASPNGKSSDSSVSSLTTNSLVALNQALAQAETDRITAEQKLRQAGTSVAAASAINNPVTQQMRSQLADLQSQLQENQTLYKKDFPAMVRLRDRIAALQGSLSAESSTISGSTSKSLAADYRSAAARERQIRGQVNALKTSALDLRDRSIQYTILQREVDTNRALYDGLLQRFKEVSVAGGVGENLVSIVDRAQVPGRPFSPNLPLNVILGLLAGLLVGMAAAVAREIVSDTIETPDDVEEKLGLRTLGIVPRFSKKDSFLKLLAEPRSPIVEAYQSVVSALRFSTQEGAPRTLLVTSSRAAEGKSSTALAIAQTFASSGLRVLLVDADMRKPTFKVGEGDVVGLSNLLTGDTDLEGAIYPVHEQKMWLLPSGPIPLSPAELLSTDRFATILAQLAGMFEMVVIDGPPVLGLADAPLMGAVTDGTVVVLESRAVRGQAARGIVARLRSSESHVIGVILTKYADRGARSGYGYGYGYGASYGYGYGEGETRSTKTELRLIARGQDGSGSIGRDDAEAILADDDAR